VRLQRRGSVRGSDCRAHPSQAPCPVRLRGGAGGDDGAGEGREEGRTQRRDTPQWLKDLVLASPPLSPPPPTHTPGMRVATCAPVAREQQRCLPAREQQRCLPDAARTPGVYAQAEYGARIRKLICAKKLMPRATH